MSFSYVLPGLSLFLMEQTIYIPQRPSSLFLGEAGILFCSGLQDALR
jgi:hypothetical protein